MKNKQTLVISLIMLLSTTASQTALARMYQWVDPNTGTTQLSGKPPSWYRGTQKGPRIYVIEKGKVIDDTAIKLVDEERLRLRNQAFSLASEKQPSDQGAAFTVEP